MPASPPPPLNCTPTSPDVSLLRSKLQRQVSKVCRYRHHIINYQTFLSCHKTPVGFSSRSVITHPLDDEEKLRLKELHQSFSTGLTLLALKSAKRHFCQAQDTLSKLLEDSRSRLNKAHSHQLAVAIQCYGARLDEELTARRLKKWQKNGICPKPLRLSGRLELGITKTKRQRRSTRRKKAKGGNSKDTAPTNKKRRCRGGRKTRLRRELRKLATAGSVERTKLLHVDKTVYNISKTALTQPEMSLLKKGLTFCPATRSLNRVQLEADLHEFYRRLRLRDYFADAPQAERLEISALDQTNLRRKSLWQPPRGSVSSEVETFISVFHESVKQASATHPTSDAQNLSKEERLALKQLQNRTDIVIRPADKGSAVVVQDTTAYRDEVTRQLSDDNFYKKLDRDPTVQNNAKIRQAVGSLQERGVINSKTARDLVETKIKTPHFYTLPKIHKSTSNPPWQTHCELSPCTN